jgi:hypothetical protein
MTARVEACLFGEPRALVRPARDSLTSLMSVPRRRGGDLRLLGEDEFGGAGDDLGAAAAGVLGGEEGATDRQAEGEQGAGLDLVRVGAEGADLSGGRVVAIMWMRFSRAESARRLQL